MRATIFCTVILLFGCVDSDNGSIDQLFSRLQTANNSGDLTLMKGQYLQNATWFPPGAREVQGWDEISKRYEAAFATYSINISFQINEIDIDQETAYVVGNTIGHRIHKATLDSVTVNDKFIVKLHYTSNSWRIKYLIWNSSLPNF